jgi:hypothetical protein
MFFDIKDYRMSSDNQLQIIDSGQTSDLNGSDRAYRIAALLVVSVVYLVYISPMMRARALTEKTAGMKATFRWADLLTKTLLVYLLAYVSTCNVTISIVITLVFLLFTTQEYDRIVIETKDKEHMIENMTGDEDEFDDDSDEDIDADVPVGNNNDDSVMVNESDGVFEFSSDRMVYFPLNGIEDPAMADDVGGLHVIPDKVQGLILDTVAESEREAVRQGLGMNVTSNQIDDQVHHVRGVVFDLDTECGMAPITENFDSINGDSDAEEQEMRPEGDANHHDDMSGEERGQVSKEVDEAIDEKVDDVAKEVEAEKKDNGEEVAVSDEDKKEVKRAVRFVTQRMSQDGKTVTHHDLLMICRMVYGQMFRCEGILKTVVRDVGLSN